MTDLDPDQDDLVTVGGPDADHRLPIAGSDPPVARAPASGLFIGPEGDTERFLLLGEGIAGGEGITWQAQYRGELTEPLTVAVKQLQRPPGAPPRWPTPADVRRWEDQRALLQYLKISHLVRVIDIFMGPPPHRVFDSPTPGEPAGPLAPYVVMEWIPGPTLNDELHGRAATSSTIGQRLAYLQHAAQALHGLHSRTASGGNPSLHRDVKPTNCIIDPDRGLVVVDLGTMRRMDDGYDLVGFHTPSYTAPEVMANPRAARQTPSDLYSLGALAYFCVLGQDPPLSDGPEAVAAIGESLLAGARAARLAQPQRFVAHPQLMLDPDPARRPVDALFWARRLAELSAVRRRVSGRVRAAVLVTVVALIGGGAVTGHALESAKAARSAAAAEAAARLRADGSAKITSLKPHGPVRWCQHIDGTSTLPPGRTLLLAMSNLNNGDPHHYLQEVDDWKTVAGKRKWGGFQFFGTRTDGVSQTYRLDVLNAPLAGVEAREASPEAANSVWTTIPAGSIKLASVDVLRVAGPADPACLLPN